MFRRHSLGDGHALAEVAGHVGHLIVCVQHVDAAEAECRVADVLCVMPSRLHRELLLLPVGQRLVQVQVDRRKNLRPEIRLLPLAEGVQACLELVGKLGPVFIAVLLALPRLLFCGSLRSRTPLHLLFDFALLFFGLALLPHVTEDVAKLPLDLLLRLRVQATPVQSPHQI